jgi:hypothetical protein
MVSEGVKKRSASVTGVRNRLPHHWDTGLSFVAQAVSPAAFDFFTPSHHDFVHETRITRKAKLAD